jgi:hypothetical protein
VKSAFQEAHFSGPRTLAGIFLRELDPLSFTKQLEHRAADGAAVEEVLDSTFIADESKSLIDEKASDGSGRHNRVLR